MDASLQSRAEQLVSEIARQAETAEDLNSLMRLMMKSAMERMLNTEMDVHLGRKSLSDAAISRSASPPRSSPPRRPRLPNGHRTAVTDAAAKQCKAIWAN